MSSPEQRGYHPEKEGQKTAQRFIDQLRSKSPYQRERLNDGALQLTAEKEGPYRVESIESKEHPNVGKAHRLLVEKYGEDEVDPYMPDKPEWDNFGSSWDWHSDSDTHDLGYYMMHTAEKGGNVEAVTASTHIPLKNPDGEMSGDSILQVGWHATKDDGKIPTLGSEVLAESLEAGQARAQRRGENLTMVVAEEGEGQEKVFNEIGGGRLYFRNKQGKLEELRYVQPPLDWHTDSGKPDSEDSPSHLNIALTSGEKTITRDQLIEAVRAIYEYNNLWLPKHWDNQEAYERAKKQIMGKYLEALQRQLKDVDEIQIITAEERDQMKGQKLQFVEHTDADEE